MRRAAVVSAWLVGTAIAACGELRENPIDTPDANGSSSSSGAIDTDANTSSSGALADARPDAPPLREDFACVGADAWENKNRRAECETRRTFSVGEMPSELTPGNSIDIAWSPIGRVCIVQEWLAGFEEGHVIAYTFDSENTTLTVRASPLPRELFAIVGKGARVVAADSRFLVLGEVDDQNNGGDVWLWRLPHNGPFEDDPTLVFTNAVTTASLGLAVRADGALAASALLSNGTERSIATRLRGVGSNAWAPVNLLATLEAGEKFNHSGEHHLLYDDSGTLHAAFVRGLGPNRSQPRYSSFTEGWQGLRTLDNNSLDGHAGHSVHVTVRDFDEKNVVYLAQRKDEQGNALPSAELRIARWRAALNEEIEHEVLARDIDVDTDESIVAIQGTASAATDASGALHVVFVRRDMVKRECKVYYLREALQGSARVWLEDELSASYECNDASSVALAVEPGGRPHIAYTRPGVGVVYATRYDR